MKAEKPRDETLRVEEVTKLYGYGLLGLRKFRALDSVSFTMRLEPPRIFVLAGETGSGKSTLLRIILGMEKPDMGRVLYRGVDIHRMPRHLQKWFRREVQAIFQDPYETFNPLRRVDSYLFDTARRLLGIRDRRRAEEEVEKALEFAGLTLDKVRGKYPHEFSGGELQRISIVRALIARPRLLLADEPVSMLDASLRVNVLNMLKEIETKLGISVIYVTHDLATAYYVGDEIGVLYRGTLVEYGPIEKVFSDPLHPYTKLLLDSLLEPDPGVRERVRPVKLSAMELREYLIEGCRFANRCPYAEEGCWKRLPPMVEVDGRFVRCWRYAKEVGRV